MGMFSSFNRRPSKTRYEITLLTKPEYTLFTEEVKSPLREVAASSVDFLHLIAIICTQLFRWVNECFSIRYEYFNFIYGSWHLWSVVVMDASHYLVCIKSRKKFDQRGTGFRWLEVLVFINAHQRASLCRRSYHCFHRFHRMFNGHSVIIVLLVVRMNFAAICVVVVDFELQNFPTQFLFPLFVH